MDFSQFSHVLSKVCYSLVICSFMHTLSTVCLKFLIFSIRFLWKLWTDVRPLFIVVSGPLVAKGRKESRSPRSFPYEDSASDAILRNLILRSLSSRPDFAWLLSRWYMLLRIVRCLASSKNFSSSHNFIRTKFIFFQAQNSYISLLSTGISSSTSRGDLYPSLPLSYSDSLGGTSAIGCGAGGAAPCTDCFFLCYIGAENSINSSSSASTLCILCSSSYTTSTNWGLVSEGCISCNGWSSTGDIGSYNVLLSALRIFECCNICAWRRSIRFGSYLRLSTTYLLIATSTFRSLLADLGR